MSTVNRPKAHQAEQVNAKFAVAIKRGRLQINIDLPVVVVISICALLSSPLVAEILKAAMNPR